MPATPIFDDAQVIKALTYNGLGLKWTGSEIKYNFHFSVGGTYWHLNARQQSMAEYWMGAWNDLVAVRITRVGDDASTNIDLANETREDISYVNTTFSVEGVNALSSASVVFNDLWGDQLSPENGWPSFYVSRNLITPTFGNYGAMAYGHEIGHTLGLSPRETTTVVAQQLRRPRRTASSTPSCPTSVRVLPALSMPATMPKLP